VLHLLFQPSQRQEALISLNAKGRLPRFHEPEEIDEWTRVLTADGYIGYIKDKRISAVTKTEIAAPEFEEPVYSNISKD
jgi:SH3-like domain-containing protein